MGNVDLATIDHSFICQLSVELSATVQLMVSHKTTTAHIMRVQTLGHMTLVDTGSELWSK